MFEFIFDYPFFSFLILLLALHFSGLLPLTVSTHIDSKLAPVVNFMKSLGEAGTAFADTYNEVYVEKDD